MADAVKQMISHVLQENGILAKLKAELRASVYLAIHDHDVVQTGRGLDGKTDNEQRALLLSSKEGRLLAALVLEFLNWNGLKFTSKVYEAEMNISEMQTDRESLLQQLHVAHSAVTYVPLLLQLLQEHLAMGPGTGLVDTGEFRSTAQGAPKPHQQGATDQANSLHYIGQGQTDTVAGAGALEAAAARSIMGHSKEQIGLSSSVVEEVDSEEGLTAAYSMQDGEEEEGYHTGLAAFAPDSTATTTTTTYTISSTPGFGFQSITAGSGETPATQQPPQALASTHSFRRHSMYSVSSSSSSSSSEAGDLDGGLGFSGDLELPDMRSGRNSPRAEEAGHLAQLRAPRLAPLGPLKAVALPPEVASSSAGGMLRPSADALREELCRAGLISGGGGSSSSSITQAASAAPAAGARAAESGEDGDDSDEEDDLPLPAAGGYASASGGQFGSRGPMRPYQSHRSAAGGQPGGLAGVATALVQQHSGDDDSLEVPEDIMLPAQGLGGDYSGLFDGDGDDEAWAHNPVGAYGRNLSLELQITGLSASDTSKDLEQLLSAADLLEDVVP